MTAYVSDGGPVRELELPVWAQGPYAPDPIDPLSMYASGRLMAFGAQNAMGKRVKFWRKRRMAAGANQMAQGRDMLYRGI